MAIKYLAKAAYSAMPERKADIKAKLADAAAQRRLDALAEAEACEAAISDFAEAAYEGDTAARAKISELKATANERRLDADIATRREAVLRAEVTVAAREEAIAVDRRLREKMVKKLSERTAKVKLFSATFREAMSTARELLIMTSERERAWPNEWPTHFGKDKNDFGCAIYTERLARMIEHEMYCIMRDVGFTASKEKLLAPRYGETLDWKDLEAAIHTANKRVRKILLDPAEEEVIPFVETTPTTVVQDLMPETPAWDGYVVTHPFPEEPPSNSPAPGTDFNVFTGR